MLNQVRNNFWGPTFLSDTHRDYRSYVPHLFFCGTLNSFFGSSNVGSTLYMQSPMSSGHLRLSIIFMFKHKFGHPGRTLPAAFYCEGGLLRGALINLIFFCEL